MQIAAIVLHSGTFSRLLPARLHIAVALRVGTTTSCRVAISLLVPFSTGMVCARHCSSEVFRDSVISWVCAGCQSALLDHVKPC